MKVEDLWDMWRSWMLHPKTQKKKKCCAKYFSLLGTSASLWVKKEVGEGWHLCKSIALSQKAIIASVFPCVDAIRACIVFVRSSVTTCSAHPLIASTPFIFPWVCVEIGFPHLFDLFSLQFVSCGANPLLTISFAFESFRLVFHNHPTTYLPFAF